MTIDYYFDPACPWTWYTASWLTQVADDQEFEIHGHPMSLWDINKGEVPDEYRDSILLSRQALRLVSDLDSKSEYGAIWRFYRHLGNRIFGDEQAWSVEVIEAAANEAGIQNVAAIFDESFDDKISESTSFAMNLGGSDIGSPVLKLADSERGFHGPIVAAEPMSLDHAIKLWEATQTLVALPSFYELKHGR